MATQSTRRARRPSTHTTRPARRSPAQAMRDPDVILDVLFEDGLLFLSIRNIGSRPVHRVSVIFHPPIVGLGGAREISALPLFRNIEFLAPGREIRTLLDASASYFQRGQPEQIRARISYQDVHGRRREASIRHDLGIYRAIGYVPKRSDVSGGG